MGFMQFVAYILFLLWRMDRLDLEMAGMALQSDWFMRDEHLAEIVD